jgi:hypothetical protein
LADIEKLQIYKDTRGMSLAVLDFVGKFPKKYKYVLGDRIVSDALDTLDFVIEGCHAYNRESKRKQGRKR